MNRVTLLGNLGKDPDVKQTPSGNYVAKFSLATTAGSKEKKYTEWHTLEAWDKQAELAGAYLKKGSKVLVEGRLKTEKWTDKENVERWTTKVVVGHIEFVDTKPKDEAAQVSKTPTTVDDIPF